METTTTTSAIEGATHSETAVDATLKSHLVADADSGDIGNTTTMPITTPTPTTTTTTSSKVDETTHSQTLADFILKTHADGAGDVVSTTKTPTETKHIPTPADAILKTRFVTDPQDITSESEPPTPHAPTHPTNEQLRAARAEKRAAKHAEKHANAERLKQLGDVLFTAEQYEEAYIPYLEATQVWPSNPMYWILLCTTYIKLGWYEEAAHSATRALTLDPKDSDARYLRGLARLEQRLFNAAKIDFETVLAHVPTHIPTQTCLSVTVAAIASSQTLGSHVLAPSVVDNVTKDLDFGYPHYPTAEDEDNADILDDDGYSDSSDCAHVGNGVPCRFYNHAGCTRGAECPFSHAPDERSIRDELGKNVCTYSLLSTCKFGALQCVYSHSPAYLPKKGWWTSEEKKEEVKAVMAMAEERKKVQRDTEWEMRQLERERRAKARAKKEGAKGGDTKDKAVPAEGTAKKKKSTGTGVRRGKGNARSKGKAKAATAVKSSDKDAPEVKSDDKDTPDVQSNKDAPAVKSDHKDAPFTDYQLASAVGPRTDALEVNGKAPLPY